MKRILSILVLTMCVAAATIAAESSGMVVRAYKIMGVGDDLIGGSKAGDSNAGLNSLCEKIGVNLPEGSWVRLTEPLNEVHMLNTEANHRVMADFVFAFLPTQVRISAAFVAFPRGDVESAMRKAGSPIVASREILAAWRDGKGRLDGISEITTRSGVNAQTKSVREVIYPTEIAEASAVSTTNRTPSGSATLVPASFETREVGVILNVTPTVGPDGRTIDLTLVPELCLEPEWKTYDAVVVSPAKGVAAGKFEQPFFHSRNVTTSVVVTDGEPLVIGGMESPTGEDINVLIVTARIIDAHGRTREEYEGRLVK